MTRALLSAGDAATDERDAEPREFVLPAFGVSPVRVAAVDHHVVACESLGEGGEGVIGWGACRDHDQDPSGAFERADEGVEGIDGLDAVAGLLGESSAGVLGEVEAEDVEAVICGVEGEISPHDTEADDAEVRIRAVDGSVHAAGYPVLTVLEARLALRCRQEWRAMWSWCWCSSVWSSAFRGFWRF